MKNFAATIDVNAVMSSLDWTVFGLALLATFGSIWYGHRKKVDDGTEEASMMELLIMGRQLTLPLFVATLVSTWYGGIFGVTKIAFEQGIYNFVTQGVFWYIAYLLFAFFLVHKISRFEAVTLPDLIGKMFGPKSAYIGAIFNFFNVVPIAYTISIGLLLSTLFGGSLVTNMFIGMTVVIGYSAFDGLRSVVYSDLIQFFVMCLGVFLVILFSVTSFGGMGYLESNLPESYFSLTGTNDLFTTFAWGLIALSTLVDPNFYQRCFAAKSTAVAKKGIIISTVIWVLFDLCTTFGAMYAKATIPEADSQNGYLIYALQVLPDGFRGFFIAGILATILSTLDSYLFIAGTTLSHDIFPRLKVYSQTFKHILSVIFVSLLSIGLAVYFEGNIKVIWKTLGSYAASCLLLPVLSGYMWPGKIKDNHFVAASILGIISTTYWRLVDHEGIWANIDEIYIGMLTTGTALLIARQFFSHEETIS